MNVAAISTTQSITTKFYPPTTNKLARIKVKASGRSYKWWTYDYELTSKENHNIACVMLADYLDWSGDWIGGRVNEDTFVFVDISRTEEY